ncbi:MAG: L,D-transpeptidase family protein [Hyphomicrobiales bacterium]
MLTYLHVRAISPRAVSGLLTAGALSVPCFFGRSGMTFRKREGDGATPMGVWWLRRILYRADRIGPPRALVEPRAIRPHDGWCEAVGDRNYNRLIRIPYGSGHETLRRGDRLYDIVVELSHNERPRIQGHGSAVFFHLHRGDGGPTAGCIAVSLKDMKKILALCGPRTRMVVGPVSRVPRKSPCPPEHGWRRN